MKKTVWLTITYKNDYGRVIGHHINALAASNISEIMKRYHIDPGQVITFEVDGETRDIGEVLQDGENA